MHCVQQGHEDKRSEAVDVEEDRVGVGVYSVGDSIRVVVKLV